MKQNNQEIEKYRVHLSTYERGRGNNGAFVIRNKKGRDIRIISSRDKEWEHVSVSLENRCPTWDEMCLVKDLFFEPEEAVMQFHPKKSQYINIHPFCLHLWRKIPTKTEGENGGLGLPPEWMV